MTVTFPAIRPTDRRLIPSTVPQSVTRTINGRTVRRPFASHGGGMRLEVEFVNRPDDEVEAIRQVRNAAGNEPVLLPDELWAGDPELLVFVGFLPPDTAWRFSGDVEVEWAKRGRATVRVAFVNYRRGFLSTPEPPQPETGVTACSWQSSILSPTVLWENVNTVSGRDIVAVRVTDGSYYTAALMGLPGEVPFWAIVKTDTDGNYLWGIKLSGPLSSSWLSGKDYGCNICEGKNNGVFFYGYDKTLGALVNIWAHLLFEINANGVILNFSRHENSVQNLGSNEAMCTVREGGYLLYVPQTGRVYGLGDGGHVMAWNANTLVMERWAEWSTNRIPTRSPKTLMFNGVNVVLHGDRPSTDSSKGSFLTEMSPDLLTQLQHYSIDYLVDTQQAACMDSFGALYSITVGTTGAGVVNLTKHAASAGGYVPLWRRSWPTPTGGVKGLSALAVRSNGEIVVTVSAPDNTGSTDYLYIFLVSTDGITVKETTTVTYASSATIDLIVRRAITYDSIEDSIIAHEMYRYGSLKIPVNLPAYNTLRYQDNFGRTITVTKSNAALTTTAQTLPSRVVVADTQQPRAFASAGGAWSAADLGNIMTYENTGQCKTFTEVAGFAVSETTTTGAAMSIGANNWYYQTSLTTAAGNIYFAGLAQLPGQAYAQARWFIAKYDKDLNLLWANWLEGPYATGTLPSVSSQNGPALAEGPGDGVFVVTKGKDGTSSPKTTGASFRIYLLNSVGALLNTAAWQVAANEFGDPAIQTDEPAAALYVPSQDKLYIAGRSHLRVVMRGLTLDQPYVADAGGTSQPFGGQRIFWLPDKQRVVFAGTMDGAPYSAGSHVTEYSADLQTRYQYYGYNLYRANNAAMDQSGAVYLVNVLNGTTSSASFQLTKLSSSDGGYIPLWSKTFLVSPLPSGSTKVSDVSVEVMPDGRIAVATSAGTSQSGVRDMRAQFHVISPDGTKVVARTRLLWGGVQGFTTYYGFVDFVREVATCVIGPFTLGKTSFRLPTTGVDLPLGSTAVSTNANKNMTGNTDYTEVLLTDVALPSRTVITAADRNGNPMVKWSESAWTTSDLTATVQHVTKSTGPLQAPQ